MALACPGPLLCLLPDDTAYAYTRVKASLRLVFSFEWFL
jgi:hypothetical protein